MKIYLAGLVPKGNKEGETYRNWRKEFIEKLDFLVGAEFVDPRDRPVGFDESDFEAVFSIDCQKIKYCDLTLVNGDGLGIGGAQEILIAKYFKKPVIVILPKDTNHRKSNIAFGDKSIDDWIHPFLYCTCDLLLDSINDLTKEKFTRVINSKPKGIDLIDKYIDKYKEDS